MTVPRLQRLRAVRRHAANAVCAALAATAFAIGILWARSYWYQDIFTYRAPDQWYDLSTRARISSWRGFVMGGYTRDRGEPESSRIRIANPPPHGFWRRSQFAPPDWSEIASWKYNRIFGLFTFRPDFRTDVWTKKRDRPGTMIETTLTITTTVRYMTVPHWFLIALLSLWPALRFGRKFRRRRRSRAGHCPHCGYDLRAHTATPGARCPECGHPVTPPAGAASTT